MRLSTLSAMAGFIMLVASLWSPLLRPFGLLNYDLFELNKPYAIAMLIVALLGLAAALLSQMKLAQVAAGVSLLMVILLFVGAQLQIHSSFSFIPFKRITYYLHRHIYFKWAWLLMLAGALLALISLLRGKPKFNNVQEKF